LEANLWGVQKKDITEIWKIVKETVEAALEHGTSDLNANDIFNGLLAGRYQLWVAWAESDVSALAVTEIRDGVRGKVLSIFICTGRNRENWFRHLATIEKWGVSKGCKYASHLMRPGWKRGMKTMGYKQTHILMEKEL
jgi:hypothetical protein